MTWLLTWLNVSVVTLNAMLQLLVIHIYIYIYIYRFDYNKNITQP